MTAGALEPFLHLLELGQAGTVRLPGRMTELAFVEDWPGAASAVEASLASLIYWGFYNSCDDPDWRPPETLTDYRSVLPEEYGPDPGWRVIGRGDAFITVRKNGRRRRVALGELATGDAEPGSIVSLARSAAQAAAGAAFVHIAGRHLASDFDRQHTVRFYLNVDPQGAAAVLNAIVTILNRFETPFLYKSLVRWPRRRRSDSAVLYVPRRCFRLVRRCLEDVVPALGRDAPRFTFPIREGLAAADDPPGRWSFGQRLSLLVARGALMRPDRRIDGVRASFEAAGLNWQMPWLNAGSAPFPDRSADVH